MSNRRDNAPGGVELRYIALLLVFLAIIVFIITWAGIRESRSESMKLLQLQGTAFTEALSEAANNAIVSERFFDYLVHKRYSELVIELSEPDLESLNDQTLSRLAQAHNLHGVFVYSVDSSLVTSSVVRGTVSQLPDYVVTEVMEVLNNPEENYILLLDTGEDPDETVHYYIEITNRMDRVIVIIAEALYYVDALSQTQIGYLVQKMSQERGVEYIIFQSSEGIIFSSSKTNRVLAIESDPFLAESLESDSVRYRRHLFEGQEVLELVRPFASKSYPFGLLRVGLSLENYQVVARGYDQQMILLSAALFILVVVALLYLSTRRKGKEIAHQYHRMKSISDKIFEQMLTGVAAVDSKGKIVLANDAFEKVFGIRKSVGVRWDEVVTTPELSFEAVSSGGEPSVQAELKLDSAGESRSLLVAVSRMLSEDSHFDGMVTVIYDVTHIRDLEQKSARRERLSEMGNLAAGVAHEIRNPLNTISIAAQRLAGEFAPTRNTEEYLSFTRQIRAETKRLNDIITRFLALARDEKERRKRVSLNAIVTEWVQLVKYEADSVGIELTINVASEAEVGAEPDGLKQVLTNLYNNAKEALDGSPGKVAVTGLISDGRVSLRFADSGPGIPDDIQERVFTPYYTTKDAGTGLGLPTVHRIISDLGGEIGLEESQLGGAEFVITFPAE